jgi:hypothetical protein
MDLEIMGKALGDLIPGDSTEINEATLGLLFACRGAAGVIDERTRSAATRFARDHGCQFLFDGQSSRSTFLKLPGRWHELIGNLCTDLGRETPGTEDFQINTIIRSAKLRRVHQIQKRCQLKKRRSSVSENFRRRCVKFYEWVRTAIHRIRKFGPRLCICSITLAFVSQTKSDHPSDSADGRASSSNSGGRRHSSGARGRVRTKASRCRVAA